MSYNSAWPATRKAIYLSLDYPILGYRTIEDLWKQTIIVVSLAVAVV